MSKRDGQACGDSPFRTWQEDIFFSYPCNAVPVPAPILPERGAETETETERQRVSGCIGGERAGGWVGGWVGEWGD